MSESFRHATSQALRTLALGYPEVSEGQSCVNRAFKARKKNFLFVGEKGDTIRVMLRLGPSIDSVRALADTDDRISVGRTGWATLSFAPDAPLPSDALARWVDESYRTLAAKTLVRQLPEGVPAWPADVD